MGDFINKIREQVTNFFSGLSRNKRIMLIGGVATGILVLTIVILQLTKTEYVVIAQGLTPADAQVITTKLDELGIEWKDSNDTSQISVAESDVSKARMELAVSLDTGSISWEDVLNNESITMTSQTREQMIIQAKAAEVEESIETIDAVEDATVILQLPKESNYFIKDEIESKASIVLQLKKGRTLNEEQVNGIVNLIASSVDKLEPANITVLDTSGLQLNDPDNSNALSANTQFDLQQRVQNQLQEDLTTFLETVYGINNVEIKPNIVMDFNQESETQKIFSPPIEGEINGMVRSATTITEDVVNGGATGVPGTDSNTGETTSVVESDTENASYKKASETLNYELNEIYREIVKSQGDIKSMSIGVLLNSKALVDGELTEEHKTELVNLIAMSAGTDKANIQVFVQEFPDPMEYYDTYTGQEAGATLFGIPVFVIIIVVLLTVVAVVVVMLIMTNKKKKREEAEKMAQIEEEHEKQLLEEIEARDDTGSPKYHIEKFVDQNPEAAAALLRAWLNDN